ncbi:MAG: hypothetical protein HEQ35_12580 [Gloeotrichia echinulata IR180]|jgi:hypothetical protein
MHNRRYPPPYLRYLKARLWNLGQPGFWVTAIFLSVMGFIIQEYWSNPDFFTYKPNKVDTSPKLANSSLSDEDQAIAADIDNLPVLLNDAAKKNLPVIVSNFNTNTQTKKSESLFGGVINKPQSLASDTKSNSGLGMVNSASAPGNQNMFVQQAENLMQIGTNYNNNQSSSEPKQTAKTPEDGRIGLATQSDKSQNLVPSSPLQTAINRATQQNLSTINSTTATPTNNQINTMGSALYNSSTVTPLNNNLPSQTLPANTGLNRATGYIQPPITNQFPNSDNNLNNTGISAAPINISPDSIQSPNSTNLTPPTPVGYGNYGWQQLPIEQQQPSNSRPVPGPYGGVQMNGRTFP